MVRLKLLSISTRMLCNLVETCVTRFWNEAAPGRGDYSKFCTHQKAMRVLTTVNDDVCIFFCRPPCRYWNPSCTQRLGCSFCFRVSVWLLVLWPRCVCCVVCFCLV